MARQNSAHFRRGRSSANAQRADGECMKIRVAVTAIGLGAAAFLLGACGGGGGGGTTAGSPSTTAAPVGSGVKAGAGGSIGGPVNTARDTVNQLNQQQRQEEQ